MDKENVMYAYNEILFNFKKEGNSTISDNMDEPWGQYMLSEITQSQKDKYCIFHLYEGSKVAQLLETENKMVVARDQREGKRRIV